MALFTGTETADIADFLQDKIAPNALGVLQGEVELLSDIPAIPFSMQERQGTTNIVRVPKALGFTANRRAELNTVTDQKATSDKADIPFIESEVSFPVDHMVGDVFNEALWMLYIQNAIVAIVDDVMTYAFEQIVADAASAIGSNAAPLSYAVFVEPKGTLTNNRAPKAGRYYYVTPETMAYIMAFTEYQGSFGFQGQKIEEMITRLAGFTMRESIYLPDSGAGKTNVALSTAGVSQVWIPQSPVSKDGTIKRIASANGYTIAILVESVPGTNAGTRCTVSTQYGIKDVRPELVVSVDSDA